MVRCQAAVGLLEFAVRKPEYLQQARQEIETIDYLSDGATPHFVIRDVLSRVLSCRTETDARYVRDHYLNLKKGWNV